jgi:hypothetical protein
MKQAIADLLERTRTNFETISATSDSTVEGDQHWTNCGPTVARAKVRALAAWPSARARTNDLRTYGTSRTHAAG